MISTLTKNNCDSDFFSRIERSYESQSREDLPAFSRLTQHSLAQASQLQVGVLEGLLHLLVQGGLLALDQDGGAAVQDPLRRALHHQQVAGLARLVVVMDGELRGRRERKPGALRKKIGRRNALL